MLDLLWKKIYQKSYNPHLQSYRKPRWKLTFVVLNSLMWASLTFRSHSSFFIFQEHGSKLWTVTWNTTNDNVSHTSEQIVCFLFCLEAKKEKFLL